LKNTYNIKMMNGLHNCKLELLVSLRKVK